MPLSPADIDRLNGEFRSQHPAQILQWAAAQFPGRVALQSSMQKTASALMHMVHAAQLPIPVLFVDTGVHFPETLALRDQFARDYGLDMHTIAPARTFEEQFQNFGRYLHLHDDETDPSQPGYNHCCRLRKEEPFLGAIAGRFDAVIGGLRRGEGGARRNTEVLQEDPRLGILKVYPLAYWSEDQIDEYLKVHNVPVNELHSRGFLSIGCQTCTTPVAPGEPARAGRWRHIREARNQPADEPMYCGINFEDRNPARRK